MHFGFETLKLLCQGPSVIVADAHVAEMYGKSLQRELSAPLIEVPRGEAAKTREVKQTVEDRMLSMGCSKETSLIGLGGGSTTDLATFVAATFMRGIDLILVPTTLLAMVDAAIGGKGAVNTSYGKNLIGTIYPPRAVVIELKTLSTLPQKEWVNGWAEVLKMGLVAEPLLLEEVDLKRVIHTAAGVKERIVAADPHDQGVRRILNFGHTVAHGLEALSDYTLPHGEAVAIGTLAACDLSMRMGLLEPSAFRSIEALYTKRLGAFTLPRSYSREALLRALAQDKKRSHGGVRFVLLERIGKAHSFDGAYCRTVEEETLKETLMAMEERHGAI